MNKNPGYKTVTAVEFDDALKVIIEHEQKGIDLKKFSGFDISSKKFTLRSGREVELKILRSRCHFRKP